MDNEEPINSNELSSQSQQGFSTEREFSEYYSADEPSVDIPSVPETFDPHFKSQSGFIHPSEIPHEEYASDNALTNESFETAVYTENDVNNGYVQEYAHEAVFIQEPCPCPQPHAQEHAQEMVYVQESHPHPHVQEPRTPTPVSTQPQVQTATHHAPVAAYAATPILVPTPAPVGRSNYKKRNGGLTRVAAIVLAALVLIGFILIFVVPWDRTVTFNGQSITTKAHTTLSQLADANPNGTRPGDLLAIDGSVIEEGKGFPYSFTVNGQSVDDYNREVNNGDEIIVSDGLDMTEEYSEESVEIAPPVTIEGVGAVHRFRNDGQNGSGIKRVGMVSGIEQIITESEPSTETMERFNVDTGDDKVVALTFDDGPWPEYTEEILGILAENDAKATFFTVGNRIGGMEDTVRRASESGHQICTHSWDHAAGSGQGVNLDYMTDDEQREEISKGMEAISNATGEPASTVVRVPGGNLSENTAKILHEFATSEIGWNIDTNDWQRPGASVISERIQAASPGDIILMHDGGGDRSQTATALREALPILREQGYRFITIDELLGNYAS